VNRFRDRADAGRQLAARLASWRANPRAVVVGLPRGGVVVAAEVAASLGLALDVLVVRKLGLPGREEVAMGAIGEGGVVVLDAATIRSSWVTDEGLANVQRVERDELERRVRLYRGDRPATPLAGRDVLIVDDGIATGATARAACRVARARGASRVVVAVPVASTSAARALRADADEVVSLFIDGGAFAVGASYDDFDQTTDAQVLACLSAAPGRRATGGDDGRDPDGDEGAPS